MSQTDAERLAAIRERLAEITPGPWVAEFPEHREDGLVYAYNGDLHIADVGGMSWDAEFIAHAPEDIAYLLSVAAERDALQALIEAAIAQVGSVQHMDDKYGTHTDRRAMLDVLTRESAALAGDQPEATPEPNGGA